MKEVLERLNRSAETIRNTDPQDLSTMEVGDEFRQGDLRIVRLPNDFAKKHKLEEIPVHAQLAPGSTQGSRHILKNLAGVKMFRVQNATPLDGPVFTTETPNDITHPEHGDVVNIPPGCYAVPGQRAFAEELRRTAD
jgi:hypothetical protein